MSEFVLVLTIIVVCGLITTMIVKRNRRTEKSAQPTPVQPAAKVVIESMSNGSVQITSTSKGAVIKLSGGSSFRGTVNGKRISIDVPNSVTWDERFIES